MPGLVCQNGLCRPRASCGGEDDCEANEDCIGGRCVPAICRGSVDCEDGLACRDGICVEEEVQAVETLIITAYPRILRVDADPVQVSAVALDVRGDVIPITSTRFTWIADNQRSLPSTLPQTSGLAVGTMNRQFDMNLKTAIWLRAPLLPFASSRAMPPTRCLAWSANIVDAEDGRAIGGATVRYGMQEAVADETGIVTFEIDDTAFDHGIFSRPRLSYVGGWF